MTHINEIRLKKMQEASLLLVMSNFHKNITTNNRCAHKDKS